MGLAIAALAALGCERQDERTAAGDRVAERPVPEAASALPEDFPITNVHEHALGPRHVARYLEAARAQGIRRTVLVASPERTLRGKGSTSAGMDENLTTLLEVARQHPGEIVPFAAVAADAADPRGALEAALGRGARGLKLYSGHGGFHAGPLDAPAFVPLYALAEERGIPVLWHVRLTRFGDELDRVLRAHPRLRVVLAHYGLVFWRPIPERLDRLRRLLQSHPNLFVDTSLGSRRTLVGGLASVSRHRDALRQLVLDYPDRFVWGTDMVVTGNPEKTVDWFAESIRANRAALEQDSYYTPLAARWSRYWRRGMPAGGRLRGLALPGDVLARIYRDNAERWLAGAPNAR